jgi:hypothetical protein
MPADASSPCDEFYDALAEVPHESLRTALGTFESLWDGGIHEGCEVEFQTNDSLRSGVSLPDFVPFADTEMYVAGWRMVNEIGADGPGSGIYGIRRESSLCVVRWEQPAYIDDDGDIVQSDTLRMWVQCRDMGSV